MLEFDYTNVLASSVSSHGLSPEDFADAEQGSSAWLKAVESARKDGEIGFGDLPFDETAVAAVAAYAREHAFPNILILGIGGSALGPAALESALGSPLSGKRLVVLDNIDPDFVRETLDSLKPADTLVNVIAKSGVTAETMASLAIVRKWVTEGVGAARVRDHFVVTTDPAKGDLLAIARDEKWPAFAIPPNVGGRFSVLTPVGTLPAALLGLDIESLMAGARQTALDCRKPLPENPALTAAFVQCTLDRKRGKSVLVLFPYSQKLWKFAFWFKQLWGESLGKRVDRAGRETFTGQTPTAALGVTDQHSQLQLFTEGPNDKAFLFFGVRHFERDALIEHPYDAFESLAYLQNTSLSALFDAERQATEMALTEAARPNGTVYVDRIDERSIGSLLMFSQYVTAYAGEIYNINAFDQPGVEYGKKLTFSMMGRPGFEEYRQRIDAARRKERAVVR